VVDEGHGNLSDQGKVSSKAAQPVRIAMMKLTTIH
jgi:hypothetical protein